MAKPYTKITKTEFKPNYNVVKVLTDRVKIMEQLKTFKSNNQAVAFGFKKQTKDMAPSWFIDYAEKTNQSLQDLKHGIQKINDRLDNLVKLNNLKE